MDFLINPITSGCQSHAGEVYMCAAARMHADVALIIACDYDATVVATQVRLLRADIHREGSNAAVEYNDDITPHELSRALSIIWHMNRIDYIRVASGVTLWVIRTARSNIIYITMRSITLDQHLACLASASYATHCSNDCDAAPVRAILPRMTETPARLTPSPRMLHTSRIREFRDTIAYVVHPTLLLAPAGMMIPYIAWSGGSNYSMGIDWELTANLTGDE
jgi:hypothetical protein